MIYRFSVSTPENTAQADKVETRLKLSRGIIHQLDVKFPPGPQGYLYIHINNSLNQVWPSNTMEQFSSSSDFISFREYYELLKPPYELQLFSWNLDDTYAHSVIIRIGLLKRKYILPRLF